MMKIGFIGGTGQLGAAIAIHLAQQFEVILGSRSQEKAKATIEKILREKGRRDSLLNNLAAAENREVARTCDLVLLTVPQENAIETVMSLKDSFAGNQVLLSTVSTMKRIGREFISDIASKSISEQVSEILPKSIKVATAFQTVPAHILYEERSISSDVLVACDSQETYESVGLVIRAINGLRPLYLGSLRLSSEIERLTALLLNIAIKNKLKSPTLKFNSF